MAYQSSAEIRIVDGESYSVSNSLGDIRNDENSIQGFYFRDTRFLSNCTLRINNQIPSLLGAYELNHFWACHYSTLPYESIFESHPITVIRYRAVGNGLSEVIILKNYVPKPVEISMTMSYDSDFADIMEIREAMPAKGKTILHLDQEKHNLIFTYQLNDIQRKAIIDYDPRASVNGKEITFKITIPAKGEWKTSYALIPVWGETIIQPSISCQNPYTESAAYKTLQKWLEITPKLESNFSHFQKLYNQSLVDLEALKIYPDFKENAVAAAGLPWYIALFGRDSLTTCYQSCFINPNLGVNTLKSLARLQGKDYNDFRDEEPGKILHELRVGERTALGELPYTPYYGAADTTQLFLILLDEVYRWTGDNDFINEMKEPALKALNWIDKYGDLDRDGYVEYRRRSPAGLINQCWKDSDDSILFKDGRKAESPIATCEIQGYTYDAKLRIASLAEQVWLDNNLAEELRNQAKILKERFNNDFWIEDDGGYFAVALDKDKNKVDSVTSNMGQLLWSGIVEDNKAKHIAQQLMKDSLYCGWGIRTMSTHNKGYNPIEYHNGTVWPHDNSLIAAGLSKYGFRDEANNVMMDIIKASSYFDHRLPELFAGYEYGIIDFPIMYPKAAFPQAWGAGTCILFLRTILGLEPDLEKSSLKLNPHLPQEIKYIRLDNIKLFNKKFSIYVDKNNVNIEERAL